MFLYFFLSFLKQLVLSVFRDAKITIIIEFGANSRQNM